MGDWKNVPVAIDEYQGFVYIISRNDGKYAYIGKKNFWVVEKKPPLKGRKNKRHVRKESDWKNYWSSNTLLQADVKKIGGDAFERVILMPCKSKAMMSYFELYYQMLHNVLFDDYFLNGVVNARLNSNMFVSDKEDAYKLARELKNRL